MSDKKIKGIMDRQICGFMVILIILAVIVILSVIYYFGGLILILLITPFVLVGTLRYLVNEDKKIKENVL
ncbi:MAG: hypothetical protein J7M14_03140 [Planctomycetes bacterium]|nr:hypothetical protein [Planctomycetota bacterium]